MVFFSCNACGESLKKNQVEKHYQFKCRNCHVLSCVDCSKEFWGDEYKEHTKCISEEEKYSGKNFQPKANANKGEKKQEAWVEQVQGAIDKLPAGNPKLKGLLEKLGDYPNIPRKKNKFSNFLKSSLKVWNQQLVDQAWDSISQLGGKQDTNGSCMNLQRDTASASKADMEGEQQQVGMSEKKQSKRERKEERQKKKQKVEKKDKLALEDQEKIVVQKKKGKKRKHQEIEEETEEEVPNTLCEEEAEKKSKKKKKKHHAAEEEIKSKKVKMDAGNSDEPNGKEDEEDVQIHVKKGKFHWEKAITEVLTSSSEKEMSLKRLRKKVLAEFNARGGDGKLKSEEKLWALFNKKVTKNSQFRVLRDRVKLLN